MFVCFRLKSKRKLYDFFFFEIDWVGLGEGRGELTKALLLVFFLNLIYKTQGFFFSFFWFGVF